MQRRAAMAIAQGLAFDEGLLGQVARALELTRVLERQREIVQRGRVGLAIAQLVRQRDARLKVRPGARRAEDAEDVVGLGQGVLVLGSLGEPEGLARQARGARPVAGAMRREAPIGEDPGLRAAGAGLVRGRVVALGVDPIAAAVVDLGELVLDRGPRSGGGLRRGQLVAPVS